MALLKRQERAVEYRSRALAAQVLAEASLLANVRERHEAAAARWRDLAELDERSVEAHTTAANTYPQTSAMLFGQVPLA